MKIALSCTLSLALAPVLSAQMPLPKSEKVVSTTLTQIRKSPDAFRGVWVRFNMQFGSLGKISNPFFTQFEPSRFANFYGWADEQRIWQKDQYEDLFGLMFVNKQSKIVDKIYGLRVYDRIEVVGVVQNVFQGQPWIELVKCHPLGNKVNTATLSHIYRGETLMKKRDWKRAIAELSLAPAAKLPNHVLGSIHKDLAVCFLRLGESKTATTHISQAVKLLDKVDPETRELARLANTRPETFLDRAVSSAQVEDYQRPMWEAFTGTGTAGDESGEQTEPGKSMTTPAPAPAPRK